MKIAVISMIREPWGGSEELWCAMAREALMEGHTIIHLSFGFPSIHPRLQELKAAGAILYQRPGYFPGGLSAWRRRGRMLANFIRNRIDNPFRQVFRHRPDMVLYNGTSYSISKEKLLLRAMERHKPGCCIICQLNTETDRGMDAAEKRIVREAYERAHRVFFVSQRNRQMAERHLGCTIPNAVLVRNPVNMEPEGMIGFPPEGKVQMALVGNLITAHKGQDVLISVLREEKWRSRDWTLNIYGEGPDRAFLEALVDRCGLRDRVVFWGRISYVREIWKKNHLLLMPSHMEGMPLAIVEAMLCGRPCVATDVGGIGEWIEDDVSGFIAAGATASSLDGALERAWRQRRRWGEMGKNAYGKALGLYDPEPGKTLLASITAI